MPGLSLIGRSCEILLHACALYQWCAEETALYAMYARNEHMVCIAQSQPPAPHLHSPLSGLVGLHDVGVPQVHAVHGLQGASHRG